ncbi:hypothetical protein AVEN_140956-1 [Araneus ventricosus]|uniref:Uncharacterized protein n=1 Tax=Araneus ventricosus TaxID=182803 RepID=A0A4Y2GDR0_ARAVE|nr:hypothetical protein AVEN_140956-1 [Araneus ventricosus]
MTCDSHGHCPEDDEGYSYMGKIKEYSLEDIRHSPANGSTTMEIDHTLGKQRTNILNCGKTFYPATISLETTRKLQNSLSRRYTKNFQGLKQMVP